MPERLAKPTRPWALRLLPPFPAVAQRVLSLVDNDTGAHQISECIKLDATFTAEILRVMLHLRDVADFKILVDICGVDWPQREKRFDLVYHLLSLTKNARIRVKAKAIMPGTRKIKTGVSLRKAARIAPRRAWRSSFPASTRCTMY